MQNMGYYGVQGNSRQGWVFAMAKTIFAGTVKKTVKTMVKKPAKTLVFAFGFINKLLCSVSYFIGCCIMSCII